MYSPITTYLGGEESVISEVSKPIDDKQIGSKPTNRKLMIIRAIFILAVMAFVVMQVIAMFTLNKISERVSDLSYRVSNLEYAQPVSSVKSSFTPINYLNELNLFKSLPANEQHEYLNLSKEDKRAKYPNAL